MSAPDGGPVRIGNRDSIKVPVIRLPQSGVVWTLLRRGCAAHDRGGEGVGAEDAGG